MEIMAVRKESVVFDGITLLAISRFQTARAHRVYFYPARDSKDKRTLRVLLIYESACPVRSLKGFHIHHRDRNPLNNELSIP